MLEGKILCRKGMAFLGPENIKILGGNVTELREEYCQRNILSKKM